ncbi:MAG: glycerol-3-phosphate dehydrogenase C-terminal domain-containing protein, partial [Clostridia bacterium]
PYGVDEREINTLVARYGTNTAIMTDECRKLLKEISDPQKALLIAELHYCLNEEMVMTISDFLIRRTGKLLFERESLDSRLSRYLAHELVMQLGGTSMEVERQVNDFAKEFHTVKTFL